MLPILLTLPLALVTLGDPCASQIPGNMPDIDQVRRAANTIDGSPVTGLDNNGFAYCVPASTLDIFLYLANNGYPSLMPGPGGYLGGNAIYNTFTDHLVDLGQAMNTDPTTGTNHTNWSAAISSTLSDAGLVGSIITSSIYTTSLGAPSLNTVAGALDLGWPTAICCGWYVPSPNEYVRDSGHCFVARSVSDLCTLGQHKLSIRDPATDNTLPSGAGAGGDPFRQSLPSTETYLTNPYVATYTFANTSYSGPMERMSGYGFSGLPQGTTAFIDALRLFIPAFGLSPCCGNLGIAATEPSPSGNSSVVNNFALPPARAVIDIASAPSHHRFFAIIDRPTGGLRTLWQTDRAAQVSSQVAFPISPFRICTGREDSILYILADDGFLRTARGTQLSLPTTPPAPIAAITFDHTNNQLVAFSASARRIFRFNASTLALISNQLIPSALPLGSTPRITISPTTAHLWLASGTNRLDALFGTGAVLSTAATITQPALIALGIDADDRGHIFTSSTGLIREFAPPIAPSTAWTQLTGGKWATMPATSPTGAFVIARSTTNFIAGTHDHPTFTLNTLPDTFTTTIPDCPPDINNSGTVTVQDIFDFLALYFANDPRADFNDSGTTSVQDIFDFLTAYFAGC